MNTAEQTPNMADVARAAGVSPATVSRCLNNPGLVRQEVREHVLSVIEQLGYVPHAAARALASKRSRVFGAIFPSLDYGLFRDSFSAVRERLEGSGYMLAVASSNYSPARERTQIRNMLASGVDGLVLVGSVRDPETYTLIRRRNVPYVLIWVQDDGEGHPAIAMDNFQAVVDATSHLIELGHRRLAFIDGNQVTDDRARARLAGFRAGLKSAGLRPDRAPTIESEYLVETGRSALQDLMASEGRPTGIICGADAIAYGVIFEAAALGLAVPHDLSVVGFDDDDLSAHIPPGLTTVRAPQTEMGRSAVEYLMARMTGEETVLPPVFRPRLVVRGSTGPAPGGPEQDAGG